MPYQTHLKRSLRPMQRETPLLRASLRDRLGGDRDSIAVRELAELERRVRDLLALNARGELSAADVVSALYEQGWDK